LASSAEAAAAVRALGAFLTGAEASAVAARLQNGESFTGASAAIESSRRPEAAELMTTAGLRQSPDMLVAVLRAVAGARSAATSVSTLWTMPGHLAQSSPLTTSLTQLVKAARSSVVCSTFNFQETSGLWIALRDAASRPEIAMRVYVDAHASNGVSGPDAARIAANLRPGVVLRTRAFQAKTGRNHAKFLCVDHRFLVVTSANFSWSAEYGNVELGVMLDNPNVAESVEREMRGAEHSIYEVVDP
jgi:phosphatidylserine/phosphatidylglycerophosphate/cardiolipin synthase-like enzyme